MELRPCTSRGEGQTSCVDHWLGTEKVGMGLKFLPASDAKSNRMQRKEDISPSLTLFSRLDGVYAE